MSDRMYSVSSTPHVSSNETVDGIMKHVVIALLPATIMGVVIFGPRAVLVLAAAIIASVLGEYAFNRITHKPSTIGDFSAVVTGLLLGLNLPVDVSLYVPVVGGLFAVIVVKMLFGGLGQNIVNPALAARAFLLTSYPTPMTTWPVIDGVSSATPLDGVTSATPLALLQGGTYVPQTQDYIDAFVGNIGGCIGETCKFALILGGLYLLIKGIINWRTPVFYIGSVFVFSAIIGRNGLMNGYPLYELLTGGLMLGAFFMATDYSSSPITLNGKIIMGIGCGILTVIIRVYGGYPEGVSYSILIMNLCVPLIDRYVRPKVFGVTKPQRVKGEDAK